MVLRRTWWMAWLFLAFKKEILLSTSIYIHWDKVTTEIPLASLRSCRLTIKRYFHYYRLYHSRDRMVDSTPGTKLKNCVDAINSQVSIFFFFFWSHRGLLESFKSYRCLWSLPRDCDWLVWGWTVLEFWQLILMETSLGTTITNFCLLQAKQQKYWCFHLNSEIDL